MYVWRLPLVSFAVLATTVVLVIVLSWLFAARRRTASAVARGVLSGCGILAVLASPFLMYAITEVELRRLMRLGVFGHYGVPVFLAPAAAAIALLLLSRTLFPLPSPAAAKWRAMFWAVSFLFALLNLLNWCSPGWCERFGFPIPYSWWSDSIGGIDQDHLTAGTSALALILNAATFLATVSVMGASFRRAS